ncbi:unnamed protein product [Gongylonema pulchrum]|uniref:Uncharacterized protein n=1 Tax=Gongylonema pulchrum TaxID=637853 RepID=A0A183ED13_9BILA|nr:unnamed protein product [Gongylonema pulchrum]
MENDFNRSLTLSAGDAAPRNDFPGATQQTQEAAVARSAEERSSYLDELIEEVHLLHRFRLNDPDQPRYIFALTCAEIHRVWKLVYARICENVATPSE